MSVSNYLEEKLLNLVFRGTAYTGQATTYVKLHIGDPGEDGTANPATETSRKAATFNAAANPAGTVTSNADISWIGVAATETISHISLWDASTLGNPLWSGPLDATAALSAGGNFTIASGDLIIALD